MGTLSRRVACVSVCLLGCTSLEGLSNGVPADAAFDESSVAASDAAEASNDGPRGVDAGEAGSRDGGADATGEAESGVPCMPLEVGDASTLDGGSCGPYDAGADGGSCHPALLQGFQPFWHPPRRVPGACTAQQITDLFNACFGTSSDPTTCSAFTMAAANTTCAGCMMTPSTATDYGPLISRPGYAIINRSGCVALLEPCNEACGQNGLAVTQCESASCESMCAVGTTAYSDCAAEADGCGCAQWVQERDQCVAAISARGSPAAQCFGGSGSVAVATIGAIFCM